MKFSILLPTRNRLQYLRFAVESVRRQDYADWEIVVSDNFSEDDIAGFVRGLNEPRIKYVRTDKSIPVTDNWNNALNHSTGDYVIMLGDDDALMRGCLSILHKAINEHNHPEFIYAAAYQYAYPGVMPDAPDGYLLDPPPWYWVFRDGTQTYFLSKPDARRVVGESLRFQLPLAYNMQHMTISRALIDRLKPKGPFFQSPYPDYYATNAMFLVADRILILPKPIVAIGITPKSFGAFFFSGRESLGVEMLMNAPDDQTRRRLEHIILPGATHNTSWMLAMEFVRRNFTAEHPELRVDYRRYRLLQTTEVYRQYYLKLDHSREALDELRRRLTLAERFRAAARSAVYRATKTLLPEPLLRRLVWIYMRMLNQYPDARVRRSSGVYRDILDVFDRANPEASRPTA